MTNDAVGTRRDKLVVITDGKSKGELTAHLAVASQANEGTSNDQNGAGKGRGSKMP